MSIVFVFALITLAHYVIADSSWAELQVPIPPPSTPVDDNFTYFTNPCRIVYRVDDENVEKDACSFFSVENDVIFQLFTQKNPTEPQILELNNDTTVKTSHFDWRNPTRILIHGWCSEGLLTPRFADAYLVRGKHKVNFIAVNWQKGSDIWNYRCARYRVNEMGEHVARFVDFMSKEARLKIQDLTIVGHSLGAHISGIAGKKITNGKVGKIVGLDPARFFFKFEEVENRLDATDASYVEVIYTCSGTLAVTWPIGATNFYPNGGRSQPGCGMDILGPCAHGRAYEYYIESIANVMPQFLALECDSLENLQKGNCSVVNEVKEMGGEPGNKNGKGIFYLQTNDKSLFAKGYQGILETLKTAKTKSSMKLILQKIFMKKPTHDFIETS
ncbi:pancreatic lipase-related protein 2-like [Contarinia nasturtii]|uniref:pancreatic lipase-related protein 2-like n=1 Tax=Contarinia nasturtii TaxID=265458 RepID=UPI0012D44B28|nr:pancreatic lipase-related protein 2-like [Contarinia nasturtii]